MTKWDIRDVVRAIVFNAALVIIAPVLLFIIRNISLGAMTSMFMFGCVPLILSIPFTYAIKLRGKRVWIAELILIVFTALLLIYVIKPIKVDFIVPDLMSGEGFGFFLLFVFIHCIGLLLGSAIGCTVWNFKKNNANK